jgi:hypothetical protein
VGTRLYISEGGENKSLTGDRPGFGASQWGIRTGTSLVKVRRRALDDRTGWGSHWASTWPEQSATPEGRVSRKHAARQGPCSRKVSMAKSRMWILLPLRACHPRVPYVKDKFLRLMRLGARGKSHSENGPRMALAALRAAGLRAVLYTHAGPFYTRMHESATHSKERVLRGMARPRQCRVKGKK